MSYAGDLLPRDSSGPFEHAIAAGVSDDLPIPYAAVLNAYTSPVRFLPWLAAHHSVDLWFDDWSDDRKREMIAQAAGVSTVYPASPIGELKGMRAGAQRYLDFVDADIVDLVSHPARFTFGRAVLGRTPINHLPFTAHYLVRVTLEAPVGRFQVGRSSFGRGALRPVDLEPLRRAKRALSVAKVPDTQYSITFAWRRPITIQDGIPIDGSHAVAGWMDRKCLD
ncbi:phage tail protein I [Rhizobiales bacterium RZME27]|uniref:Phage tail protein I n=1 Tax=Endobacterium cereale TaxID=2663029 RepID=A0A6A8A115_9HYPH|nr:phage tail protein I [Endobacterium cereale]MQY44505.1 phage tail protein I [Endobacterium cereale]